MSPPNAAQTIPGVLAASARAHPDIPAVVEEGRRVTYAELDALVDRAAAAYVAAGLKPGERVAIWAQNGLDWLVAAVGAQAAGGVISPINTRFKRDEAAYVLNHSRARILVVVDRFLGVDYPAMLKGADTPALARTVRLDSAESAPGEWQAFLDAATPEHLAEARARRAALSASDVSDLMFTSGTTGDPKGVITTHGQNVAVYREWSAAAGLVAGDRFAVMWPFFHCSGYKSGCLSSLICAATIYPVQVLDPSKLMQLIEREQITVMPGPPTLFQTLLGTPQETWRSLGSLRVSVTGAAAVAPVLIERMRKDLGIATVLTAYGLTETCGTVTLSDASDDPETVATTVGRAMPGVEIRIVSPDGHDLPLGEAGEIWVRGFCVMQGFDNAPEETAKVLDADGWLRTGDVGILDERGYLKITDRLKEVYISGGFNCYPAEIEKIMARNPDYAQVAVVGVADERMGEVGKAFVVPRAGADVTPEKVIAWCRAEMANYKTPRYVEVVESLPANATGKVQKFRLDRTPVSRPMSRQGDHS
jgi:acyl-CoA synthetase (AMP-forming)/AMP-acid ligase II